MIEAKKIFSLIIMFALSLLILRTLYLNLGTLNRLTSPIYGGSLSLSGNVSSNQNTQTPGLNTLEFPKSEGPHQNLQTEWWYFAGHLEDVENPNNKFGITLIFEKNPPQIKFNLTDGVGQKNFSGVINLDQYDILAQDKLAIGKGGIYWLEQESAKYKIHFSWSGQEADLDLIALKSPWLFSNDEEQFYYQQSRLAVSGDLSFSPKQQYQVKGYGLIDHQGFKAALPWKSWRWYNLQLDNQTEVVFVTDFTSKSGNFYQKNNLDILKKQIEIIDSQQYSIKTLNYWQDPKTKVQYPIKWQLEIPERNINLIATSIVPDQVIEGANGFYEGTCQVTGTFEGQAMTGRAQFEYQP